MPADRRPGLGAPLCQDRAAADLRALDDRQQHGRLRQPIDLEVKFLIGFKGGRPVAVHGSSEQRLVQTVQSSDVFRSRTRGRCEGCRAFELDAEIANLTMLLRCDLRYAYDAARSWKSFTDATLAFAV